MKREMNKKFFIILMACMGWLPVQAQTPTFSISEFSIPAGGMAKVDICLDCEAGKWGGFQFDLVLPTGLHVYEDEYGFYYEYTDRIIYNSGRVTKYFNVGGALQSDGTFRVLIDNSDLVAVKGTTGPLLTIGLQADDNLDTDWLTIGMQNIVCSKGNGEGTVYPADNPEAGRGLVRVDVVVGSTGWATFSWPRSCDFTDVPVEAYIGTVLDDGCLHLERVYNVRQNTGILLCGEPGTYNPSVGANLGHDYDDTQSNILGQTASGPLTAGDGNCYALTCFDEKVGFYPVRNGVVIPQYRAYLPVSPGANVPLFVDLEDVGTGVVMPEETPARNDDVWYRLDGTSVIKPSQPGIYVKRGKKIKL